MEKPLLIIGATSGIGKLTMEEALQRGLPVRAFARSADKGPEAPSLERFPGAALNAADVSAALAGVGGVIVALGIRERLAMLWEEETLFSRSTEILLEELHKAQVGRLIVVTGVGAGRSRAAMSSIERLGRAYADKPRQEAVIEQSSLDWTIARPVILTNRPASGRFKVLEEPSTWRNGLIARADVARYLVDAYQQDLHVKQDVVLAR